MKGACNVRPFQKIAEASKTTGLSQYFLRNGCKGGTVPHVKSGTVYLVNVPALLRRLDIESSVQDGASVPLQERDAERRAGV